MDTPISGQESRDARPTLTLRLGGLAFTGRSAVVALLAIVALIVALLVYLKLWLTNGPLLASGALWILFIGYWTAAAKNAAPTKSSESRESRRRHQRLMNAALFLLFVPV